MLHPERCRWHDQSALNAAAAALGHPRGRLSPLWNYQTEFMAAADPRRWGHAPAIWHFTGFPKPWNRTVFPWVGGGFGASFALGAALAAETGIPLPPMDEAAVAEAAWWRERMRRRLIWVTPWRRWRRARLIREALGRSRPGGGAAGGERRIAAMTP